MYSPGAMASMSKQPKSGTANWSFPTLINRDESPNITRVVIDGEEGFIGDVRDFRGNATLRNFVPNEGRTSLSWVRLGAHETHQSHTHPTPSLVIICEGWGELIGATPQPVEAGDLVIIPSNTLHGFIGRGPAGLLGFAGQVSLGGRPVPGRYGRSYSK